MRHNDLIHQRSLPPLSHNTDNYNSNRWQSFSLPTRSRNYNSYENPNYSYILDGPFRVSSYPRSNHRSRSEFGSNFDYNFEPYYSSKSRLNSSYNLSTTYNENDSLYSSKFDSISRSSPRLFDSSRSIEKYHPLSRSSPRLFDEISRTSDQKLFDSILRSPDTKLFEPILGSSPKPYNYSKSYEKLHTPFPSSSPKLLEPVYRSSSKLFDFTKSYEKFDLTSRSSPKFEPFSRFSPASNPYYYNSTNDYFHTTATRSNFSRDPYDSFGQENVYYNSPYASYQNREFNGEMPLYHKDTYYKNLNYSPDYNPMESRPRKALRDCRTRRYSRSMNYLPYYSNELTSSSRRSRSKTRYRANDHYSSLDYHSLRQKKANSFPNYNNPRTQYQPPQYTELKCEYPQERTGGFTSHLPEKRVGFDFKKLKQAAPQHCTQIMATLVISLGPLCAGLGKGYSSPALASMSLQSSLGHHFMVSKDQGSWIASLSLLGAFFGSVPAGFSIKWGRKTILCIVSIPFAASWLMTYSASSVYMLYLAAFLGGLCTAFISFVTPVYISEIAHPDIRGCLCSFSKLNSNVGMLISYSLGAVLDWRKLAMVTAIVPTCLFIFSLFIPETPSFLLYIGKDSAAIKSLKWFRGPRTDVTRELTVIKSNIIASHTHQPVVYPRPPTKLSNRPLIRPIFITCGLMFFQKFSGANAFNFYAVPILSETFVGLNPYRAAIVVAFVQICAGMASSALVDTVGRRPLLIFSNMLMSAALAAFGFYVYFKGAHQDEDLFLQNDSSNDNWKEADWVPLFCILVIEIAYAIGVSPISWLYIGEIFPLKHRGYGSVAAGVSYACSFASVKTFVDLQKWLGLYGTFWFYATFAALALSFTLTFVPETRGKSLQEMQEFERQKETLI